MQNDLLVQNDAHFAYWVINRPQSRNALSSHLAQRMHEELDKLEKSSSLKNMRAIFISANIDEQSSTKQGVWIAGGDLTELARLSRRDARRYSKLYSHLGQRLARFPLVVVMVINGAAIGGGAEFLLSGDLRIATDQASIEFRQLVLGLPTGYSSARRLISLIGLARAQHLLFLPQKIAANAACALGLFTEVVGTQDLNQRLEDVKSTLKEFDLSAVAAQKRMLDRAVGLRDDHLLVLSGDLSDFASAWRNALHSKNLDAWLAKTNSR